MKTAKTLLALLAATFLTLLVCGKEHPAKGDANRHGKKKATPIAVTEASAPGKSHTQQGSEKLKLVFTTQERQLIRNYVSSYSESSGKKNKSLPPGLARKVERGGELPPGWQKKVTPGEIITPEVLKIAVPLPKELLLKLPPAPIGTITVALDGRIVRVMEKTRQILDVLELP